MNDVTNMTVMSIVFVNEASRFMETVALGQKNHITTIIFLISGFKPVYFINFYVEYRSANDEVFQFVVSDWLHKKTNRVM